MIVIPTERVSLVFLRTLFERFSSAEECAKFLGKALKYSPFKLRQRLRKCHRDIFEVFVFERVQFFCLTKNVQYVTYKPTYYVFLNAFSGLKSGGVY